MKPDQERVKALLTDTVTLLCKNGLHYQKELKVQGLLGITTDEDEVFLVHINEKFGGMLGSLGISISSPDNDTVSQIAKNTAVLAQASNRDRPPKKDKVIDLTDRSEPAISQRKSPEKIRKRKRFSEESSSPVVSSSPVASPPPTSSHHQQTRHVPPPVLETSSAAEYYEEPSSAHTFSEGTSVDMSPEESQNCAQPTVKIKQERDDVIMIDKKPTREEIASLATTTTSHIPNRTEIDKNAMQQTYGSLGLSLEEIQGGFPHFETLDNSLSGDIKPHPAKRRASEPHSLADPGVDMPTDIGPGLGLGGPFITGMVQHVRHLPTSDTSAGSWDNSALGALPDDQIIIDDAPGCSSWNSSQLSAATASHHSAGHSAETSDTGLPWGTILESSCSMQLRDYSADELFSSKTKRGKPTHAQILGGSLIRDAAKAANIWRTPCLLSEIPPEKQKVFFNYCDFVAPHLQQNRRDVWAKLGRRLQNRRKYVMDKQKGKRTTKKS